MMNLTTAMGAILAGLVVIAAGVLKLAPPPTAGRSGPGPHGVLGMRWLGVLEVAAGAGTLAGVRTAQAATACLLWASAAWLAREVAAGRAGAPCPCFGGRTRVSRAAVARTALLAAATTALAAAPRAQLPTTEWLALAAAVLAAACAGLALLAWTLAREVASLRANAPLGALEIPEEGPPLGVASPLIARFAPDAPGLRLAVFVSPGCEICDELAPAIALLGATASLRLEVFDEQADALAWRAGQVPGSPYAVALSADGVVLAKGTFNTLAQLESVPATAWRRLDRETARA